MKHFISTSDYSHSVALLQLVMAEEDNISGQEELQSQVDPSLQRIRDYQKTGPGVGDIVIVVTYTAMSLGKCQVRLSILSI